MALLKDITPDEYRKRHRRCATCIYRTSKVIGYSCGVKGKEIPFSSLAGMFCRCYHPAPFKNPNHEMR